MEQFPVNAERKRYSKPILDAILSLVNEEGEFLHNKDGLLVELEISTEEEQIRRGYVLIEKIIARRQVDASTHLLINHRSFRIQISNTHESEGLVSRYTAYTYWEDETGEEIEDDAFDDSEDESYEMIMAEEKFRQMAEEHDAFFGSDQENEILSVLSGLKT